MEKEGYTGKQISEILKMPERAINYYTQRRIVDPEVEKGGGRGTVRRYSKKNIVELAILKQLAGYGVAFKTVESIFSLLRFPALIKDTTKIDKRGIIGGWKDFKPNTHIVLYQMDDGEFKAGMTFGITNEIVLNKDHIKDSVSVLIINVGRIVKGVKAL